MSNQNSQRALEGEAAVLTCAGAAGLEVWTACSDTIANVLHFAAACGHDPDALLGQARQCFDGDREDGPLPVPDTERGLFSARAVEYLRRMSAAARLQLRV